MTEPGFSDETLMAFADGELDPVERSRIERAIDADERLQARVEMFTASRGRAREAMAPLLDEPVPDALLAQVTAMVEKQADDDTAGADRVVPFTLPARQASGFGSSRWALPLAASITLVIGAAGGYLTGLPGDTGSAGLQTAKLDRPGVVAALNSIASGDESTIGTSGERFRAIASYRDGDGTLCREFELDDTGGSTVVAVACRPDSAWQVQFTVVAGQADSGYAPASSLESLDAYLSAVDAGEPLSPADETTALSALR